MGRHAALAACAAVLVVACGDPIVVLGDAPGFMRVVAGVGDSTGTRVDSIATRTKFTEPTAIAIDSESGTLFVADRGSVIQSGGITRPVARIFSVSSNGRLQLLLDRGGCDTEVCLQRAQGMTLMGAALLIADDQSHRIYRFDIATRALTVVAGTGELGIAADATPALAAALAGPADVAAGEDGRVFFSEARGHRVRFISADGTVRTAAGSGVAGFAGDGGAALQARLSNPAGITIDAGTLYIADADNHRVRAVNLGAGTIATVAGATVSGFAGDGGPAQLARLAGPRDVTLSPDRATLFIADRNNNRIRAVHLQTGVIRTYAGTGDTRFTGPGPAGSTGLLHPLSIATTPFGFLFIADTGHAVIWRTALTL